MVRERRIIGSIRAEERINTKAPTQQEKDKVGEKERKR
jgi:hypothetical protein